MVFARVVVSVGFTVQIVGAPVVIAEG